MKIKTSFVKSVWFVGAVSFVAGIILVLGIRVAAYSPPKAVHYHANFAVYILGQREQFKGFNYYEEEAGTSCSVAATELAETTPMSRVHMHDNVNDVVHVEDSRVTWGNFFTVLGWNAGNDYLATLHTLYNNDAQNTVTYILNGKKVGSIANTIIGDQDKLLVNYGDQTVKVINQEYAAIQNKAFAADQSKDPASCGGSRTHGATMRDRMMHMF